MAEYTLTNATAVAVGSAVPYNNTVVKGCCDIRHRAGSGIVTVKGSGCCKCPRRYRVSFQGNVTGVAGAVQLGIYLDGELLPETLMSVTLADATDVATVNGIAEILADCCCQSISVRVIEGDTVTVNTANIIVERKA